MDFKQAVTESNVAFIVGSGLSAFTTQNASTATWHGLVRDGAKRATRLDPSLNTGWISAVNATLNAEDTDTTLSAASMVAKKLKRIGERAFADWLEDAIGKLEVSDDTAARELLKYPFPILTTNYDTLLEEVGSRASADWTDAVAFHNSITREDKSIAHLHGVWSRPNSVVLSEADYQRVLESNSSQQIIRALSTLKSIVYVGFGAGMDDPNFSALREWRTDVFPNSGTTHYRLCRAKDEEDLQRQHANENVEPVVYGEDYSDLASFLREHCPNRDQLVINDAGLARDAVEDARLHLRETMITDSVLMEAGASDFESRDLIVPPVFLSMPHANYVQAQMRGEDSGGMAPIDALTELQKHDFFVIVGDEGSGLTTALKWLATESSSYLGAAAPIFVRYSDCRVRKAPLEYAIKNAAFNLGVIRDRKDGLPDYVLALDDCVSDSTAVSSSVLSHLSACSGIVKIVGCAQGNEERLVSRLADMGERPRVLYLGRMRRTDIQVLAERIAPGDSKRLTREVTRVLETEGLRRNPMTVSLLLYLVYRNAPREVMNQTSLVEAYLSLILVGIGDPQESLGLVESDIDALLSGLAETMIRRETPSLSEIEAVTTISKTLERFGWDASGSANGVLSFLLRRRVLRKHDSAIEFARYSYLTLFAAKRASADVDFHTLIVEDIFYYSPVATRLAALTRTDKVLFSKLKSLLTEELSNEIVKGLPFELVAQTSVSVEPPETETASGGNLVDSEVGGDIEMPENESPGSFGLVKSEMSTASRMSRSVRLASNILRDLDQIEDLDEKRDLLVMTLELWGRFIAALSSDPFLKDLEKVVLRDLETEAGRDHSPAWRDLIARSLPAGTAFGGMEADLASPKLAATLNQILSRKEIGESSEATVGALFLLLLVQPNGWVGKARILVRESEPTWVLLNFYHTLCEDLFARLSILNDELLELCKELFLRKNAFSSAGLRSAHVDAYERGLRTMRARANTPH